MFLQNVRSERGSAILEFITFVLVGQLLVFGGSMAIANQLREKVELQLFAAQAARSLALARELTLPEGVTVSGNECEGKLICVKVSKGALSVIGVSYL
jgi:hypothetical protein